MSADCSMGVIKKIALTSILLGVTANSFAGGFQLWEQSAAGTGNYHAGAAAIANDASTDFYNPAGMTRLKHAQVSAGVVYIPTSLRFNGKVMTQATGEVDGGTDNFVPNLHLVIPLGSRVAFGFSVTTPFGLTSDYSNAPQIDNGANPIKDAATKTKLLTINLNPSLAFKINSHLSIGAGFNAQHASADFDSLLLGTYDDENHLSAWGYGWNIGTLISFSPTTRMGLSYRSAIDYKAKGTSKLQANSSDPTVATINGELKIPATTTMSLYHDVNQSLALMASVFYTQWDVMKEITLRGAPNPIPFVANKRIDVTIPTNYHNSFNFALGANYRVTKKMLLRFGAGYDQTPTNNTDRDVRMPGADKFALALGGHFDVSKHSAVDIGFTHFFVKTAKIDNSGPTTNPPSSISITSKGSVKSNVNVFGLQYSFTF